MLVRQAQEERALDATVRVLAADRAALAGAYGLCVTQSAPTPARPRQASLLRRLSSLASCAGELDVSASTGAPVRLLLALRLRGGQVLNKSASAQAGTGFIHRALVSI